MFKILENSIKDTKDGPIPKKLIVDRVIGGQKDNVQAKAAGIRENIQQAVKEAGNGTAIKITSNLYDEDTIIIDKPGISLGPREAGGEVTLQQSQKPVLEIDIGVGNVVTINNIRLLLKGPNKDAIEQEQKEIDKKKASAKKNTKEIHSEDEDSFDEGRHDNYCIILLKSGTLIIKDSSLSLDGDFNEMYSRVSCITAKPKTSLQLINCRIKADFQTEQQCVGLRCNEANLKVKRCNFAQLKSGLIASARSDNKIVIADNIFTACKDRAIHLDGKASRPIVANNTIQFCRCSAPNQQATAITATIEVEAYIYANRIACNDRGIEIISNKSKLIDNILDKNHEAGIKVLGLKKEAGGQCTPFIWRNKIRNSGANGILICGEHCNPDIRGNIIFQSRKAGIKLTRKAQANIGGSAKIDLEILPTLKDPLPPSSPVIKEGKEFSQNKGSSKNLNKKIQLIEPNSPDPLHKIKNLNLKSFPNSNIIMQNHNQGILIVDGSSARITANKIDQNFQANIACGGKNSSNTKIKYNLIENGKQEGIFVIEGEDKLIIEDNDIDQNTTDGIVMINSQGYIKQNKIRRNQRNGVLFLHETNTIMDGNIIEDNQEIGILIKEPSKPKLSNNTMTGNLLQVKMDSHYKNFWPQIDRDNPDIIGNNEIPGNGCLLF